jgi:hypothetical protein
VDTFQYLGACELTTLAISFDWVYELYILVASVLFLFFPFLSFEVNESSFPSTFSWIYIFGPIPTLLFTSSSSSFFFFNGKSISSPFALWVKFSPNCCCRPLSVLSQCSFSFVRSSSHFLSAQELITLVGQFFMVVQGYVAALFSSSFFFCFFLVYIMLNQYLFLNSIKQLVRDLLFAILNSLRITGFTPAVILLKGVALSLSLSLSLFACARAGAHACA